MSGRYCRLCHRTAFPACKVCGPFHVEPRLQVCPVCGQIQAPDRVEDESTPLPLSTPKLCGKCRQGAGLSRRRFLFLGAAAGVTLAVAPLAVDWGAAPAVQGPIFAAENGLWQFAGRRGGKTTILARLTITGEEIRASRDHPGAFLEAYRKEMLAIGAAAKREEERWLLNTGRQRLRA